MPSASEAVEAGMLKRSQCVKPLASGSSTTTANERVPAGTPDQKRGGEKSPPSQVWRFGIAAPAWKAGDERGIPRLRSRPHDMARKSTAERKARKSGFMGAPA